MEHKEWGTGALAMQDRVLDLSIKHEGETWRAIGVFPTDRYFLSYYEEDGLDYEMVDMVVVLATAENGNAKIKTLGLNYGMSNYFDVYRLTETFSKSMHDWLEVHQLAEMVRYRKEQKGLTREQALREIKRDFLASKVRLTAEVMEVFDQVE